MASKFAMYVKAYRFTEHVRVKCERMRGVRVSPYQFPKEEHDALFKLLEAHEWPVIRRDAVDGLGSCLGVTSDLEGVRIGWKTQSTSDIALAIRRLVDVMAKDDPWLAATMWSDQQKQR